VPNWNIRRDQIPIWTRISTIKSFFLNGNNFLLFCMSSVDKKSSRLSEYFLFKSQYDYIIDKHSDTGSGGKIT